MRDGFLHLPYHTQEVSIYYRVSTGSCKCRLNYDGRSDLFNVDNKHIFPFLWLYDILHNIQYNHFSLYGAFQFGNAIHTLGSQEVLISYIYILSCE